MHLAPGLRIVMTYKGLQRATIERIHPAGAPLSVADALKYYGKKYPPGAISASKVDRIIAKKDNGYYVILPAACFLPNGSRFCAATEEWMEERKGS